MRNTRQILLGTTVAVSIALAAGSSFAGSAAKPTLDPLSMTGTYVSVFGGGAISTPPTGIYDSSYAFSVPLGAGYVIGGAVGTYVQPNIRAELELSFFSHQNTGTMTIDDETSTTSAGSFNTLYALANLWYDLPTTGKITPYLGGGVGLAAVMPDLTNIFDDGGEYEFKTMALTGAAQVGAGLKVGLSDTMSLDFGYRAKFIYPVTLQESGTFGDTPATNVSYVDQAIQVGLTVAMK